MKMTEMPNCFSIKGAWIGISDEAESQLPPAAQEAYRALRDAAAQESAAESLFDTCTKRVVNLVSIGRDLEHQIAMIPRPTFHDVWRANLQGR
jgi:hypothetical protein